MRWHVHGLTLVAVPEMLEEGKLSSAERDALPASDFVFPADKSYPIPDVGHARNALARSSGKPEEATVREAVYKRYPELKGGSVSEAEEATPPGAFHLQETALVESDSSDGTVLLHVIRPGVGRGKGNHLYEADMLRENAEVFKGWRMYVDHLSPEARRAAGGLPRSVRDLGGRIEESWWDPEVPADPSKGFGQGAVVARARPVGIVRRLIDEDPEIVEASISATATDVKGVIRGGQKVWMVEGIEPRGSVDWVTEAGAGGRVVSLMESVYDSGYMLDHLNTLSDEDISAYVREHRPGLMEAFKQGAPHVVPTAASDGDAEDLADGGADEMAETVAALMKKGLSRAQAEAQAKAKLAEAEGDDVEITPEALQEALRSEELQGYIRGLVEATLDEERELIRAESRADADRQLALRDMRDEAGSLTEATDLPEPMKARVRERFEISEQGVPSAALDLIDEVDEQGKTTKSAREQLREAVAAEIAKEREVLAAVNPTRVTGQGGADGEEPAPKGKSYFEEVLEEAGIDPEKAYA